MTNHPKLSFHRRIALQRDREAQGEASHQRLPARVFSGFLCCPSLYLKLLKRGAATSLVLPYSGRFLWTELLAILGDEMPPIRDELALERTGALRKGGIDRRHGLMSVLANNQLIGQLSRSEIYRDYERAFGEATGLPLTLRPVEDFHLAHHGKRHENPFCALMAQWNKTCAARLDAQQRLRTPRHKRRGPSCVLRVGASLSHLAGLRGEPARFSTDRRSHAAKADAHAVFQNCSAPHGLGNRAS